MNDPSENEQMPFAQQQQQLDKSTLPAKSHQQPLIISNQPTFDVPSTPQFSESNLLKRLNNGTNNNTSLLKQKQAAFLWTPDSQVINKQKTSQMEENQSLPQSHHQIQPQQHNQIPQQNQFQQQTSQQNQFQHQTSQQTHHPIDNSFEKEAKNVMSEYLRKCEIAFAEMNEKIQNAKDSYLKEVS